MEQKKRSMVMKGQHQTAYGTERDNRRARHWAQSPGLQSSGATEGSGNRLNKAGLGRTKGRQQSRFSGSNAFSVVEGVDREGAASEPLFWIQCKCHIMAWPAA